MAIHDIDLKYLRVFVAVVEHHGFTNAEAVLDINCSSISKHISSLETRLGARLCNRGRSGFEITPEGEEFYQSALKLLKAIEQHEIETKNLRYRSVPSIKVGIIDNISQESKCHIPAAINLFMSENNNINLEIDTFSADTIIMKLLDNKIDIGISYISRRISGLKSTPLYEEQSYPYISPYAIDLWNKKDIDLTEIRDKALATCTHEKSSPILSHMQNIKICNNLDSVALYALSGIYIGLLPEEYAQYWVNKNQLRKLNIDRLFLCSPMHCLYKANSLEQPLTNRFIEILSETHTQT